MNKGDKIGLKKHLAEFNSKRRELVKKGYVWSKPKKDKYGVIIYEFKKKKNHPQRTT